jgi:hypothetical protein
MSRARFQTLDLGDFAVGRRGEIRHRLGASRPEFVPKFLNGLMKMERVSPRDDVEDPKSTERCRRFRPAQRRGSYCQDDRSRGSRGAAAIGLVRVIAVQC